MPKLSKDHQPVLFEAALEALQIQPDKWYLDATFGRGGHTGGILAKGGKVIAFDMDHEAIAYGEETFAEEIASQRLILIRENFAQMKAEFKKLQTAGKIQELSGILFDFGTSSDQLISPERGFSFTSDTDLDMRMDHRLGVKAKDLLALLSETQLTEMFREYGGEEKAKAIARSIVKRRKHGMLINTTKELSDLISEHKPRRGHLHPATKVFQALRIIVNDELENIKQGLNQAVYILPKGRIVSISFHEGEDRIVKQFFKQQEKDGHGQMLDLVKADHQEATTNPRARSAKMRIFELNTK